MQAERHTDASVCDLFRKHKEKLITLNMPMQREYSILIFIS